MPSLSLQGNKTKPNPVHIANYSVSDGRTRDAATRPPSAGLKELEGEGGRGVTDTKNTHTEARHVLCPSYERQLRRLARALEA